MVKLHSIYKTMLDATTSTNTLNYLTSVTNDTTCTTATTCTAVLNRYIENQYIQDALLQSQCLEKGKEYKLPDDSVLAIDAKGNFTIEDENAKVIYQASNVREFNRYLNASDLLEEFILTLGKLGVTQKEVLHTPINLFIHWLIIQAAEKDGDPIPEDVPELETQVKKQHRCRYCGRFLSNKFKSLNLDFCNPAHYDAYLLSAQKLT